MPTAGEISTNVLLTLLKQGNDEAMEVLYPRYARRFYSYACNKGLITESEDFVQQVFLRICEKIFTYNENIGQDESWMWTIAHSVLANTLRSKSTRPGTGPLADVDLPEIGPDPGEQAIMRAYDCAWEAISETDREELQQGPGRGPGRNTWKMAAERFRQALILCYEGVSGSG
jgi:DNA-directed RNA polymerase specialized sigma24 family protein